MIRILPESVRKPLPRKERTHGTDSLDRSGHSVVLWLIGFITKVAGGLIHILLVVALVVLVINLITGRKAV